MGTKPPLSSTKNAKGEGKEKPPPETAMSRFRELARGVASVPRKDVLTEERRLKRGRKPDD